VPPDLVTLKLVVALAPCSKKAQVPPQIVAPTRRVALVVAVLILNKVPVGAGLASTLVPAATVSVPDLTETSVALAGIPLDGTTPPVTPLGSPPTSVNFSGNDNARTELINGQQVQVGTTLQAAFNQGSVNGTPSAFTLLATLRDTLNKEPAAIQSQQPINVTGQIIYGSAVPAISTTLGQIVGPPPKTTIPLTADSAGNYSIEIDGTNPATAAPGKAVFTFTNATAVDDGTGAGIVGQINAQTAVTGVTAAWNVQSQRLQLTSSGPNSPPFLISDVPSAGAVNTSNFLAAFQIPNQVSVTSNLSTQIGDIDAVINQVLSARAQIGQQIQNLAATTNQVQALANDNTTTKGGYEDTNVAQATSQFSLTQTALQAAYAVTSRLEGKTLIDFL